MKKIFTISTAGLLLFAGNLFQAQEFNCNNVSSGTMQQVYSNNRGLFYLNVKGNDIIQHMVSTNSRYFPQMCINAWGEYQNYGGNYMYERFLREVGSIDRSYYYNYISYFETLRVFRNMAKPYAGGSANTSSAYNSSGAAFLLDKFNNVPEEYMGVGCTYSASKKDFEAGKYIYISNLENGIVSIDNDIKRFKEMYDSTGNKVIFNGSQVKGVVLRKTVKAGEYGSLQSGMIKLTYKGNTREIPFYGGCGD